jgi:hypothetical protein
MPIRQRACRCAWFDYPGAVAQFPMNVKETHFGDSLQEKQLQICDILAGACSAALRFDRDDPHDAAYRDKLREAGIDDLILAGLWPSTEVTPEGLGRKGWDGNVALEWLTEQLPGQRPGKAVRRNARRARYPFVKRVNR